MPDLYTVVDSSLPPLAEFLAEQGIKQKKLRAGLDSWLESAYELLHQVDPFRDPINHLAENDRINVVQSFRNALDKL